MANNVTVISLPKSLNDQENSTVCELDSLSGKIEAISAFINVIQTRVTFLKAEIQAGSELQQSSLPQVNLDITNVTSGCKSKLNELWTAIQNLQLKAAGLRVLIFNTIARPLLSKENNIQLDLQRLSVPGSDRFIENMFTGGTQLALVSVQQKKLCYDQEAEELRFVTRQHQAMELIADVEKNICKEEEVPEKQQARCRVRVARTKIARAIINCLLSEFEVDFEQHPELLDIKAEWRSPIQY